MKDPYELRVIADALERWAFGPAKDALTYGANVLREIASEVEADVAKMGTAAKSDADVPETDVALDQGAKEVLAANTPSSPQASPPVASSDVPAPAAPSVVASSEAASTPATAPVQAVPVADPTSVAITSTVVPETAASATVAAASEATSAPASEPIPASEPDNTPATVGTSGKESE